MQFETTHSTPQGRNSSLNALLERRLEDLRAYDLLPSPQRERFRSELARALGVPTPAMLGVTIRDPDDEFPRSGFVVEGYRSDSALAFRLLVKFTESDPPRLQGFAETALDKLCPETERRFPFFQKRCSSHFLDQQRYRKNVVEFLHRERSFLQLLLTGLQQLPENASRLGRFIDTLAKTFDLESGLKLQVQRLLDHPLDTAQEKTPPSLLISLVDEPRRTIELNLLVRFLPDGMLVDFNRRPLGANGRWEGR